MKKLIALLLLFTPLSILADDDQRTTQLRPIIGAPILAVELTKEKEIKHYNRNELPQLKQEILDNSPFSYTAETVYFFEITPVQTQRVKNLKKKEKKKLRDNSYRPLIIDQDGYLVDGHHRLDGIKELRIPEVRVLRVDAPIEEIVAYFKEYAEDVPTFELVKVASQDFSQEIEEEIVVVGTRASLMSAIDKQEMSDSLISVVDSDALGDFPDTTAAEAIRRLSGISIENDQGEGRYVTVRGLSSDLNSVAINGASMVAPENGRSVLLDGLPTELLDSITVSKSLTPDQDADSIGGRVDFQTKRPSDLSDTLRKIKISTQYNEYAKSSDNPKVALTYGNPGEKMSYVLGLTYSSKDIMTYNNETGYGWDSEGFMNDDWEMRYYDLTRERSGATLDVDFPVGELSTFYVGGFYNQYDDAELRWKDEYGKFKRDEALTNGMTTKRIRHDAEIRQRYETRTISSFNTGLETFFGDWATDFQLSYSKAEEDDSDNADVTFRNYMKKGPGGTVDWSDPKFPNFTPDDLSLRDPSDLEWDAFEMWENVSLDEETAFTFDMSKDTRLGLVKFGTKFKNREKNVDDGIIAYAWDKTMADYETTTLDWPFAGQTFGPMISGDTVYSFRDQTDLMEVDWSDSLSRDFTTQEDVKAVYFMDTIDFAKGTLVVGVRYEKTDFESTAYDQDGNPTFAEKSYGFFAPSANLKLYLNNNIALRGAVWRSMSRPGFKETAPKLELEVKGEDISGKYGNPDLEPYESTNMDLALEYYGDEMTFASIGVFRKDIDNAIYPTIQKTATINNIVFNDGVETWINAESSTINGLEINLQFGLENGLFVALNGTLTDGESTFAFDNDDTFTTSFRKLADKAANASIGYDKGPWDVRLAANYRSEYLDWLADEDGDIDTVSENNSRFVAPHMQLDLTAKYKVNDKLTVKAEAVNLNNREEYYYWGKPSQISQYDIYGSSYSVGIFYTF